MNKTAMILAAGLGTRLKHLTQDRPKALVEVAGQPLLQHNIENLIRNGFDTIIINLHHHGNQIIQFIENHNFNANIYLSDERGLLMDTGGGIIQALPFFHQATAVLVHNVDILSDTDLQGLYKDFLASNDDAWLLTQERDTSRKLLFDAQQLLVGWKNIKESQYKWVDQEYPIFTELAFSGMHVFRPALFTACDCQPCSVIDLYLQLAKHHRILSREIHPHYWFDLGKIEDFERVNSYILDLQNCERA